MRRREIDSGPSGPMGLVELDIKGRILRVNLAAGAMLGADGSLTSLPFFVFLARGNVAAFLSCLRRCRQEGAVQGIDLTLSPPRAPSRAIHVLCELHDDADGKDPVFRLAMFDVTERRAREDGLERQANLHGVVAALGRLALTDPPLPDFLDAVVNDVAVALRVPLVWILERRPDGSGLVSRSVRGFGGRKGSFGLKGGEHPAAEAVLDTKAPAVYPDLRVDLGACLPPVLARAGARSGAIAPIRTEESVPFGTLEAYDARLWAFGPTDRVFLESVANLAGSFIARLRSARELADSEERFRTLVHSAPVGFCILDGDRAIFMNPYQAEIFGTRGTPVSLSDIEKAFHASDAVLFRKRYVSILSGKSEPPDLELRIRRHRPESGEELRWVSVRMTPFQWLGAPAVLVSMSDTSKTKEMELFTLKQERMATLGKVASGIAHEVRSPLSALNVLVTGMKRVVENADGVAPEARDPILRMIDRINDASGKIESIIRRALDFTRPLAVPMAPLSVNEVVREGLAIAESMLARNGVEVLASLREDLPPCRGDKRLLEQVLLNLLSNAVQAMEGRNGERRIRVTSAMENGEIAITVADTGPGIPEELRDKVFEPFFTTRGSGTGIGLSISRKIVTEHGGTLRAGTCEGGGALFTILLPPLSAVSSG
ncbi:MAG: ATP-binding protein [Thermodesulfobacteriota bacterium]